MTDEKITENLSWDKCPKCNGFYREFLLNNETVHLCCNCCKGTEFCDDDYLWMVYVK